MQWHVDFLKLPEPDTPNFPGPGLTECGFRYVVLLVERIAEGVCASGIPGRNTLLKFVLLLRQLVTANLCPV